MIELADGVSLDEGKAAVTPIADAYAAPDVQDRDEYVDSVAGQIDMFLSGRLRAALPGDHHRLDGNCEHALAVRIRAHA